MEETLHRPLSNILPANFSRTITAWLEEDCPSFDHGGFVVGNSHVEAHLFVKSCGILAGCPFFDEVFRQLNCKVRWDNGEGHEFQEGFPVRIATVSGPCRHLLLGERVALNILARCSGIATTASSLKKHISAHNDKIILAGTRKTTPGFRTVEKYGLLVGGCDTHRMDISSMTMLKDNHIAAAGSICSAVKAAKSVAGFATKVEVECQSLEQAELAIEAGADIIMLDNFTSGQARSTAKILKTRWRGRRNFLIEISGGLNHENITDYCISDVDIISTSSIHQGVPHMDYSLKIQQPPQLDRGTLASDGQREAALLIS